MDYLEIINKIGKEVDSEHVKQRLERIMPTVSDYMNREFYAKCFSMLDITLLNTTDTVHDIQTLCNQVAELSYKFPKLDNPASVCVSPRFVETAGLVLGDSDIKITSVAAGFPMAQTFIEVKALECAMVEENGADEIDVVMSVGDFLGGDLGLVAGELEIIKNELSEETILKVIIESGMLPDLESVRLATLLALSAGADYVKTSSGKCVGSATPEAVVVMCEAIRDYERYAGKKCGIKIAGGVRTCFDVAMYYAIVEDIMDEEWIGQGRLRFGASSLANELLSNIEGHEIKYF